MVTGGSHKSSYSEPEVQGQWESWTAWSACACTTSDCSVSQLRRTRQCTLPDSRCGEDCEGQDLETEICTSGKQRGYNKFLFSFIFYFLYWHTSDIIIFRTDYIWLDWESGGIRTLYRPKLQSPRYTRSHEMAPHHGGEGDLWRREYQEILPHHDWFALERLGNDGHWQVILLI